MLFYYLFTSYMIMSAGATTLKCISCKYAITSDDASTNVQCVNDPNSVTRVESCPSGACLTKVVRSSENNKILGVDRTCSESSIPEGTATAGCDVNKEAIAYNCSTRCTRYKCNAEIYSASDIYVRKIEDTLDPAKLYCYSCNFNGHPGDIKGMKCIHYDKSWEYDISYVRQCPTTYTCTVKAIQYLDTGDYYNFERGCYPKGSLLAYTCTVDSFGRETCIKQCDKSLCNNDIGRPTIRDTYNTDTPASGAVNLMYHGIFTSILLVLYLYYIVI